MPLFGWLRSTSADAECRCSAARPANPPGATPLVATAAGSTPMWELLWHVKEHESPAREVQERYHGYSWLLRILPQSERCQLENLCAQIRPTQTDTVLGRLREVMTHNFILPWELVSVYKQILADVVNTDEDEDEDIQNSAAQRQPSPRVETQRSHCSARQGFLLPAMSDREAPLRTEIPTVSSSVEHSMRRLAHSSVHKAWSLPHPCPNAPPSQCHAL